MKRGMIETEACRIISGGEHIKPTGWAGVGSVVGMGTMSFGEDKPTGAIDGDGEVAIEQAIAIQNFLPDQSFDYPTYDFLHLVWEQATE